MDYLPPERQAEIKAIAERQQKNVRHALATNRNKVFTIRLIKTLHGQIDDLVTQVSKRPDVHFDCQPGCIHCCKFRIEAVAPEVFLIARRLRQRPPAALEAVLERLRAHVERARDHAREGFLMDCPMLENDRCSVYEDRPSICRKYLSLDVRECRNEGMSAPEDGELVLKSTALVSGTLNGYAQAKRPLQIHELGQALLIALTEPDCEERWYKGETVFPVIPEARAD